MFGGNSIFLDELANALPIKAKLITNITRATIQTVL